MGFFSDIGKKTSETTTRIARETKIKLKTNEYKNKISDFYEEIGKKVYEKHIKEEKIDIEEDLKEECKEIDKLAQEIERLREELLSLNQKKQCPKCNNEIEENANFCTKCGEKQNDDSTIFEVAADKLEEVEIEPENEEKAEIVKEDLEEKIAEDE